MHGNNTESLAWASSSRSSENHSVALRPPHIHHIQELKILECYNRYLKLQHLKRTSYWLEVTLSTIVLVTKVAKLVVVAIISSEYIDGVEFFLNYVYTNEKPQGGEIICPCAKCHNTCWEVRQNHLEDNLPHTI
ncbi:hypothetical protein Lal_00029869 [Lupinus albus]|nr:hypothetical protein Lal_00029869 [Lupinus albus]